jgi:hypothetical protein
LAGPFEKGPVNIPTRITSEQELLEIFGKPKLEDNQYEYWWSASNYLSYGGSLRVIRSGTKSFGSGLGRLNNANAGVSSSTVESQIFSTEDYETTPQDRLNAVYFTAKTPGSWANGLKVCIIDNFADQTISGISTAGIQVGMAVTQSSSVTSVDGGQIVNYSGHVRGLITGIGNSSINVKIIDRYELPTESESARLIPIEYRDPKGSINASSFNDTTNLNVVNNVGTAITTLGLENTQISDWYESQTINISNTTIFWKNIAPKPKTSNYANLRNSKNDEIHIIVIDEFGNISGNSSNILEKFTSLSKASDATTSPTTRIYYKNRIRDISKYLYVGLEQTGTSSNFVPIGLTGFALTDTSFSELAKDNSFNVIGNRSFTLNGGTNYSEDSFSGYNSGLSEILNAYELVRNPSEYSINYLIAGSMGGVSSFEAEAKANTLINIAEQRKDCIATISPPRDGLVDITNSNDQTNTILTFFSSVQSSSYAVFDCNYKYTFDRFNNRFVYIPCNSDVAGLMARTSLNNYPWFSPAGAVRGNINNVIKLAYNPSQAQRDLLYGNRINPIIANNGSGFILFGDKTALGYASAFDRINVRKLFLTLERTIESAARAQLFEFNDAITRTNFINIVEPYLRDVRAKRGVSEFLVICDETNNTPDVIDANQFKADIYIKPARSINFIGLTFVATRTGVSFSEVVGTV